MKKILGIILVLTMLLTNVNMIFAEEVESNIEEKQKKISDLGVVDHIASFSEDLARFEHNGKWGYIDINGDIIIEAKFDYVYDFINGVANAIVDGKEGIIDRTGNWVFKPVVDFDRYYIIAHTGDLYKKGYVIVRKSDVDGFAFQVLNKKGKEVLKNDFTEISPVSLRADDISKENRNDEDIYFKIRLDDKKGIIGIDGKYIVKPKHDIYFAYPVEKNNEYYLRANDGKTIMTINAINKTNKFKSALKTYVYTPYDRENTTEDRFKYNYYSTKICNDAGDPMKIGEPVIDKKYHELEITQPDLTGTALANVFEKDEIDFIDFRNGIKVVKTIKGKIGYIEKNGYFFRYLEQIGDDWVYVLLDGEGQEIGRYRNYFEHYYSKNQKTEYNICGSLLNSLYDDSSNFNAVLKKIEKIKPQDLKEEVKPGIIRQYSYYYSTSDGFIKKFYMNRPFEWTKLDKKLMAFHVIRDRIKEVAGDRDMIGARKYIDIDFTQDACIKIGINVSDWANNEHDYVGSTPYLLVDSMEVLKIMTNENDGELIWRFIDGHMKSGIKIDSSKTYTFGRTKVNFEEDRLLMDYKWVEGKYNIIIMD